MAAAISHDSYKVAFSLAVDATLDSNFAIAHSFLRTGFLVRMWAKLGGAAMFFAVTGPSSDARVQKEVDVLKKCMHATLTDRGIELYLARMMPCSCLSAMSAQREAELCTCNMRGL